MKKIMVTFSPSSSHIHNPTKGITCAISRNLASVALTMLTMLFSVFTTFLLASTASAFLLVTPRSSTASAFLLVTPLSLPTALHGLFDSWTAGGDGDLDAEWEAQQKILNRRRGGKQAMSSYFAKTEERRRAADKEQTDKWAWQKQGGAKGSNLLGEWKKRRESGQISDLDDQYAEADKKGGIQLPMASFGVGGEFGVGGKFDNGGRFDLRLPYAEAGYVDEDSDWLGRTKKKKSKTTKKNAPPPPPPPKPAFKFPWDK